MPFCAGWPFNNRHGHQACSGILPSLPYLIKLSPRGLGTDWADRDGLRAAPENLTIKSLHENRPTIGAEQLIIR
jgi:hypothetical protein